MKLSKQDKEAVERYKERVAWILESAQKGSFETEDLKQANITRAKRDYNYMVKRYFSHIAECENADFHSELANKVKRNKTFKGFAEWPRGFAKSVHCTIFIPFWLHINGQSWYFLQISNCFDAAADLLEDLRAELEANPQIIRDFGIQKTSSKKWERGYFVTKSGYIGRALGIGQKVRGLRVGKRRPDFCEIDDLETEEINNNPQRQDKIVKWIERSLIPTMTGKYRRLLYSNNKWAVRMVQTILQKRHPKWFVHHIKAYDPVTLKSNWEAMYSTEYWREQIYGKDGIGQLACEAEYNQEPHTEGKIFTDNLFRYDKVPRIDSYDSLVAYWDVAYSDKDTADFNAIRVWGKKGDYFYLIKAFVRQCKPADAIEWMFVYYSLIPENVGIVFWFEAQFWNDALKMIHKSTKKKYKYDIPLMKDDRNKPNKYKRILTMLPYYQQGRIIYNIKEQSSNDMQQGTAQLKAIEPGYKTHDDSPDADEGALHILNSVYTASDPDNSTTIGDERRTKNW